jgi:outer membrane protein OmpA-like peptidoglycan-associated protein
MRFFASKSRLRALAMLGGAAIALSACSTLFGEDDEGTLALSGSPFSQGLATAYSNLAQQATAIPDAESDDGFFSPLTGLFDFSDSPSEMLERAFTAKAELAASGEEPAPEAAPDPTIQPIYTRLVSAVNAGKARFAEEAARAQSDYDCWILFSMVPSAAPNAAACKSQLDQSLPRLETVLRPAAPPPAPPVPPPAPVTQTPVPAPASAPAAANGGNFTVYFEFDSWTLTAENLTVMTDVINTARAGGQSRINIVGHTDTSGSADYNQRLSVRRANVVVEALVNMGARRQAITATGVGETDLAVQTGDNVREQRNRRTVIGLQP